MNDFVWNAFILEKTEIFEITKTSNGCSLVFHKRDPLLWLLFYTFVFENYMHWN